MGWGLEVGGLYGRMGNVAGKIVCIVHGLLRAEAVKARLASAGIPVALTYESVGPALAVTVDGLGEVEVMVPTSMAWRARRILRPRQRYYTAWGGKRGRQGNK